ncbi:MAG: hypothetical protein RJA22_382 [Verrucomicrobiota bacterium]
MKAHGWLHSTVWLDAQVNTGGTVSTTVKVWLHTLLFPQLSLALHVRVTLISPGHRGLAALVTVDRMRTVTLVPSHASTA